MWRAAVTIALALAAAASIALAARSAIPRLERRRALTQRIDWARSSVHQQGDLGRRDEYRSLRALLAYEESEAVLALIELLPREIDFNPPREAVELFATRPEPRDPRPLAELEGIAMNASFDLTTRFHARYLADELVTPTFPIEPAGFDRLERVSLASEMPVRDAMENFAAASGVRIDAGPLGEAAVPDEIVDRPWRALLRLSQALDAFIAIDRGTLVLARSKTCYPRWIVPTPGETGDAPGFHVIRLRDLDSHYFEGRLEDVLAHELGRDLTFCGGARVRQRPGDKISIADPLRALRALAALNGCAVRERDAKTLEIYRP